MTKILITASILALLTLFLGSVVILSYIAWSYFYHNEDDILLLTKEYKDD